MGKCDMYPRLVLGHRDWDIKRQNVEVKAYCLEEGEIAIGLCEGFERREGSLTTEIGSY